MQSTSGLHVPPVVARMLGLTARMYATCRHGKQQQLLRQGQMPVLLRGVGPWPTENGTYHKEGDDPGTDLHRELGVALLELKTPPNLQDTQGRVRRGQQTPQNLGALSVERWLLSEAACLAAHPVAGRPGVELVAFFVIVVTKPLPLLRHRACGKG